VKDQYVGDINDFEKYSILRALGHASGLPLVVCWMLTAPDSTGEGAKVDYLLKPERYRHLEPDVFDSLSSVVGSGQRDTRAIEESGALDGASFVRRRLEDGLGSRTVLFRELHEMAGNGPALIFFDPDIGIAGSSVRKAGKRSAMYLFADELADTFRRGHSVVVYQHFPRVQRPAYLSGAFGTILDLCQPPALFALWSARIAFFVLSQEQVATSLHGAARELASRWSPLLTLTNENEVESSGTAQKRTSPRLSPAERLENPAAFLSRSDLAQLGLERRAVDAVFRACPVISLPGYSRPLIRVCDYLKLVERSTYRDDRVRPIGRQ
jgi:hypothetical protein